MKTAKKVVLRSGAILAVAVAAASVSVPVFADFSATVAGSNMYLWRGQAISGSSPQISGSLDFKDASGVFAGVWGSSEGPYDNSSETDLYAGYSGKAGDFSYGFTLWQYVYSSKPGTVHTGSDLNDGVTDPSEWQVSLGYGPVSFSALVDTNDSDNQYYTLGLTIQKFSAVLGTWMRDEAEGEKSEYSHLDLYFQATDELKFGVSAVIDPAKADLAKGEYVGGLVANTSVTDAVYDDAGELVGGHMQVQDKDPLFYVSYSKTFDIK